MSKRDSKKAGGPLGWTPPDLSDRVAVVTGASRGAGRGIALALGDAGATVYVTGRTTRRGPKPLDNAPGTIDDTAEEVTRRGGRGIPVRVDHAVEADVAALFARVKKEHRRLDILANAVWGGNERYAQKDRNTKPFWELPSTGWQETMMAGAYAHLLASQYAARLMAPRRRGLIANVTEPILEKYDRGGPLFWMFWMLAHRGINRMTEAMKPDLAKRKIAVVALAPGFMRTERVQKHMENVDEAGRRKWGYHNSETTEYSGRAVASLASDSKVLKRSGKLLYVGDLAGEYGFKDADGKDVGNFFKKMKIRIP